MLQKLLCDIIQVNIINEIIILKWIITNNLVNTCTLANVYQRELSQSILFPVDISSKSKIKSPEQFVNFVQS